MKRILLAIFFLTTFFSYSHAQKSFTKELGIYTDNDSYTNLFNDGYYTNGFTLFYKYFPKTYKQEFPKKIAEWNLGVKMYTPRKGDVPNMDDQDRPFAGHLYGDAIMNFFYENESFMKIGISLGIIGPSSGGGRIQNGFHKFLGLYDISGWDFQVKDMLALNANFFYSKKIIRFCSDHLDLHAITDINLGTSETNAGFGFMHRLSFNPLNKIYRSGTYGSLIDQKPLKRSLRIPEFFLFFRPMVYFRAYDATIQGSMFNDNSPLTYDIKPIITSIETGFVFQLYRVNLKYSVTFNSIEVLSEKIRAQTYGTINLSYIF